MRASVDESAQADATPYATAVSISSLVVAGADLAARETALVREFEHACCQGLPQRRVHQFMDVELHRVA